MTAEPLQTHADCGGGRALRIMGPVRTYGIGGRGTQTQEVDNREAHWDKDMAAYKRFRDKGLQPLGIDNCDRLEATAVGDYHVQSGQAIPDSVIHEKQELARAIMRGTA